jgi:hypothetical protein
MSKSERNAQIQAATELFLMNGGKIKTVPAKKIKTKIVCHGKMKAANTNGGSMPTFRISSLYQQGDNSVEALNLQLSK